MLSVSFNQALLATMLFGIVLPSRHKEVDEFNGQTRGPIPTGYGYLVGEARQFKVAKGHFRKLARMPEVGEDQPRNARLPNDCLAPGAVAPGATGSFGPNEIRLQPSGL